MPSAPSCPEQRLVLNARSKVACRTHFGETGECSAPRKPDETAIHVHSEKMLGDDLNAKTSIVFDVLYFLDDRTCFSGLLLGIRPAEFDSGFAISQVGFR